MPYLLFFLLILTRAVAAGSGLPGTDISHSPERLETLEKINRYYNRHFSYHPETDDRWLHKDDFIRAGGGDCEDFALTKYQTLLESGWHSDEFRFVYARITDRDEYHIALLHHPSGRLLDSLTSDTRELSLRPDLQEQFQFTASGFYPGNMKQLSRGQLRNLQQWQRHLYLLEQRLAQYQ